MINERINLTMGFCKKLKAKNNRYFVYDTLVPGLWLKVMPSGFKSWIYFCRPKGKKSTRVVIGSFDELSPAKARFRVKKIQRDMFDGKDPNEAKIKAQQKNKYYN